MHTSSQMLVAIHQGDAAYPSDEPFHPASPFPEYPFCPSDRSPFNPAYEGVRNAFYLLDLDRQNFGSERWNPLGDLITPGDTVLLKPNLVCESHSSRPDEWQQIITNGSTIRAVLDYVYIALRGRGRAIIADGPQTDSDFERICRRTGLDSIVAFFKARGMNVTLLDLRRDRWYCKEDVIYKRVTLPGDPAGYTTIDLGEGSEFSTYRLNGNFYGADYDVQETRSFHRSGRHAYVLCRSVMDADVLINLPKMKTHKKVGVTLSLKNMVGINGYRNCLPHHTIGTPDKCGDEFPVADATHKVQSSAIAGFKGIMAFARTGGLWARMIKRAGGLIFGGTNQVIRSGNWYGNDTAWRMVLDLNKALFYFDGQGERRVSALPYLTIVDGIVAGESDGPAAADLVRTGLTVAGLNPVAVDSACTLMMGFDYTKIPVLSWAWECSKYRLTTFQPSDVICRSNVPKWEGGFSKLACRPVVRFRAPRGWVGQIEA